jgi:hypothetical protein
MGVTIREDANGHDDAPPSGTEDTAHKAGPGTEGGGAAEAESPGLRPVGTRHNKDAPGTDGGATHSSNIGADPTKDKPSGGGLKQDVGGRNALNTLMPDADNGLRQSRLSPRYAPARSRSLHLEATTSNAGRC